MIATLFESELSKFGYIFTKWTPFQNALNYKSYYESSSPWLVFRWENFIQRDGLKFGIRNWLWSLKFSNFSELWLNKSYKRSKNPLNMPIGAWKSSLFPSHLLPTISIGKLSGSKLWFVYSYKNMLMKIYGILPDTLWNSKIVTTLAEVISFLNVILLSNGQEHRMYFAG